jgi:2-phospho-L-lactate guanylyltransferase (CobY/MobA/RfbA family)
VLAVLYFALMELMLIDSSRALREAQRFRARIVATTMAESAAELAAAQLVTQPSATVNATDEQGTMTASMQHGAVVTGSDIPFTIDANAEEVGVPNQKATLTLQGRIQGTKVIVDYTAHGY